MSCQVRGCWHKVIAGGPPLVKMCVLSFSHPSPPCHCTERGSSFSQAPPSHLSAEHLSALVSEAQAEALALAGGLVTWWAGDMLGGEDDGESKLEME